MRRTTLAGSGGLLAAFLGSLCCFGPLLFVTLGVGASLAGTFEPLRPVFGGLMLLLFGFGFWTVYGARFISRGSRSRGTVVAIGRDAGASGPACTVPDRRARDAAVLWGATLVALVVWTFPTWSLWVL